MRVFLQCLTAFLISVHYSHGFLGFGSGVKNMIINEELHSAIYNYTSKFSKACPQFPHELANITKEVDQCFVDIRAQNISFCLFTSNNFRGCLNSFKEILERCLPGESRDVPKFIIDVVVSVTDILCHTKGKLLLELTTDACVVAAVNSDLERDHECALKLPQAIENYKENFPTKKQLCELLRVMRECINRRANEVCAKSAPSIKVLFELFDAFSSNCNTDRKPDVPIIPANKDLEENVI